MLEIEYVREGEAESYGWIDGHAVGCAVIVKKRFTPRRKKIAPHTLEKTRAYLNRKVWSDVGDGLAMPNRLLLPPAKIIRVRKLVIVYGEWEEAEI